MNGFHRCLEQEPTEHKDSYGGADLPGPRRLRTPPDQGQGQRPDTTDSDDDKGFPEIPWSLPLWMEGVGDIQKRTAVFALYSFVLNFFVTEGTFFHYHLSW